MIWRLGASLGALSLAGLLSTCGLSNTSPSHPRVLGYYHSYSTCRPNQYVGNRRTKALHPPHDTHRLPSPRNQVCFNSAADGIAAGYHLVGTSRRRRGQGTSPSGAASISIPGRPRPREETFLGCPPAGSHGPDPQLNLLKNRVDLARRTKPIAFARFAHLPWPHRISNNLVPMSQWSASERRQVFRYEGLPLQLIGYIASLKKEGPESPNCHGSGGYDWHVWLAAKPHSRRGDSVVTEVTPRVRAETDGFNIFTLGGYESRGTRVRITGWAMLDYQHPEQLGWDRINLWEVHPITKIEVWRGGHWLRIAGA